MTAVAHALSTQLDRVDEAEAERQARAMQKGLSLYVPGAVASSIGTGTALEPEDKVVSVLFVNTRGYSTYSESGAAHEILSTVNQCIQTVSSIVEKFGGSVVEFNGDVMMAVFGAPLPLADKEHSAVAAGTEIVTSVRAIRG